MILFAAASLLLIAAIIAAMELGRRIRLRAKLDGTPSGLSALDGAVFGLMSLLIAFTFSGAEGRFEARRQLIVQEANTIGTVWLRIDLLPAAAQPQIRADLRSYADARIELYSKMSDLRGETPAVLNRIAALQKKIWAESVAACEQLNSNATTSLVLSALNDMIDITSTRSAAQLNHPPAPIYVVLCVLAVASSLLAGFGMAAQRKHQWLHTLVFAAALAVTVYTILDLEFPRLGIIRIDQYDQALVDARTSMN